MARVLLFFLLLLQMLIGNAQSDSSGYKFILDLALVDIPINTMHHGLSFRQFSPSFSQSISITKSISESQQYFTKRLFFRPSVHYTLRQRFWRESGLSLTNIFIEFFMSYLPLGTAWLHEEWHRSVMNKNDVRSFDDINKMRFFTFYTNVSHETDESLGRFKESNNADFVRLHEAGIEAQYEYIKSLQKDNFYYRLKLSSHTSYILNINQNIGYVRFCSTPQADIETIRSEKEEGADIKVRDFGGWDPIGWLYDLAHPAEPYDARGINPTGIGIRRYRRTTDLTQEELQYLKRMGNLQRLNYISPFNIGINSIQASKSLRINFSLFHYLTSFGFDQGINLFLDHKASLLFFTFHNYKNFSHQFFGLEAELIDKRFYIEGREFNARPLLILWKQPANQEFRTARGSPGFKASVRLSKPNEYFNPYIIFSAKSRGWVAGDEFLEANFSVKAGISKNLKYRINKSHH
jgi:hypothetical protein